MQDSLKYSLITIPIYLFIALIFANDIKAFENSFNLTIAWVGIIAGGILWLGLAIIIFGLLEILGNFSKIYLTPLLHSQKEFLIILTQKDIAIAYYQYAGIFFKQVFNIQNQTLHSQTLYSLRHNCDKYTWEVYSQAPNKNTQKILHKVLLLFVKEDLHPLPQILNVKNLLSSPIYLSLIKKIGKDEFYELFQSSNPQFQITAKSKWLSLQKKIIIKEQLRGFLVCSTPFVILVIIFIYCYYRIF